MNNLNLLKTFMSVFTVSLAFYSQAKADDCGAGQRRIEGICMRVSGNDCGTNCHWEIDKDGVLKISATGANAYLASPWGRTTWHNSRSLINEVVIESGITNIPNEAFVYDNIKKITLPDTVTIIDYWAFHSAGIHEIVIPESVTTMYKDTSFYNNSMSKIYCTTAQKTSGLCGQGAIRYERDENGNLVVYNSDDTIKGVYSDYVGIRDDKIIDYYEKENSDGSVTKYNGRGQIMSSYAINPDGSIEIYDANGKLTGLKNAREITPAQAAALTKPGKNNTVTLMFK